MANCGRVVGCPRTLRGLHYRLSIAVLWGKLGRQEVHGVARSGWRLRSQVSGELPLADLRHDKPQLAARAPRDALHVLDSDMSIGADAFAEFGEQRCLVGSAIPGAA